jgi:hypothetical protein
VGSLAGVADFARAVGAGLHARPLRVEAVRHGNQIGKLSTTKASSQLFSDGEGFFWRALARPVEYQPIPLRPAHPRRQPGFRRP